MGVPIFKLVYDRQKRASRTKEGAIELRITYNRVQRFVTTGVRVYPNQWRDGVITKRLDALELQQMAEQLIKDEQWSPKQIAGVLAKEGIHISHETIYKFIREDETGELARNCRHKMKYTRKARKRKETKATNIRNRVSIHERPAEADGKRFGDWEMDLIVDKDNHAILTMIERSTNFLLMSKLKYGKKAMPLAKTVWRLLLPYKGNKLLTITTDNGSEFAEHKWISKHLGGVPVYFTDSYCSWQKGAVENTNKLIRQYIPKGTNINTITDTLITKRKSIEDQEKNSISQRQ